MKFKLLNTALAMENARLAEVQATLNSVDQLIALERLATGGMTMLGTLTIATEIATLKTALGIS